MKCLQCESSRIVTDARVVGHLDHGLKAQVYSEPKAMVFKQPQYGVLKANVCAECGFVMLSAAVKDAQRLERYQKKQ